MRKTLRSAHPGDPDLLAAFDRHLAGSDLTSTTRRGYRQDLEVFGRWLEAVRTPNSRALTAAELLSYRDHLLARGAASATVNRILQSLRRWCRWAHGRGLLPEDPAAGLRLMRRAKSCRPAGLSEEEAQALLRAAGTSGHGLARRNYALVQVGLQAGLRVGELAALVVASVKSFAELCWAGVPLESRFRPAGILAELSLLLRFNLVRDNPPRCRVD